LIGWDAAILKGSQTDITLVCYSRVFCFYFIPVYPLFFANFKHFVFFANSVFDCLPSDVSGVDHVGEVGAKITDSSTFATSSPVSDFATSATSAATTIVYKEPISGSLGNDTAIRSLSDVTAALGKFCLSIFSVL
jgi:hypothetical protein